jgi:transposase
MAKAYSDDLRRKLLEAHQQGEESLVELAERFRVSVGWAKKVSAMRRRTGRMERPPSGRRGPRSKITPKVQKHLQSLVARQSDVTLAEMQQRLVTDLRLRVSISRLWTVLQQMGLRLKKSRFTPANKIPKRPVGGANFGTRRPGRLIRRG